MNTVMQKLLKEGTVLDHKLVEIDGVPSSISDLQTKDLKGAIVRIARHLYMDGKALTVDAPSWEDLWR